MSRVGPCPSLPILVQSELRAEVNPLHVLVGGEAVRRAASENHAVVHDVRAVGYPQRFSHVVVCDQNTDAALLEMKDDLLDVGDGDGIDASKRLIQKHDLRRDY